MLRDQTAYAQKGTENPFNTQKGRIQRNLRTLKKAGHLDQTIYNRIYPTSDTTPRFYATAKIHKDPLKMQPIASGSGSITYSLASYLVDLLKACVGKSKNHIQNLKYLVELLKHIEVEEGEVITSFDVTCLFTSVPGKEVVQMAIQRAKED